MLRLLRLLRLKSRAAIDLASIMVGVLVVGILSAGAGFALLGAIPWAQDSAAKNVLIGVAAAEEAGAKLDGGYVNYAGLIAMGLVQTDPKVSAGTGTPSAPGTCFVAGVASDSGKKFYITNMMDEPQEWTGQDTSWCFDFPDLGLTPSAVIPPFTVLSDYTPPPVGSWTSSAVTPDGKTMIAAQATGSVFTSTTSGTKWTERVVNGAARSWVKVAVAPDGKHMVAATTADSLHVSANGGKDWTEVVTLVPGKQNWAEVTIASDGRMYANTTTGVGFTSDNFGSTWRKDIGVGSWSASAVTPDGKTMIAAQENGSVFTSTNSGFTWTERVVNGAARSWVKVAVAPDGTHMVAATAADYLYVSSNGGKDWTEVTDAVPGKQNWSQVTIADDGRMYANTTRAVGFTSDNFGSSWLSDPGVTSWQTSAISRDGTVLIAGKTSGTLSVSTDGGHRWVERNTAAGTQAWSAAAASGDGTTLLAAVNGGDVWKSTNKGVDWAATGNTARAWSSLDSSNDGQTVIGTVDGGTVYRSTNGGNSWNAVTFPAAGTGNRAWKTSSVSKTGAEMMVGSTDVGAWVSTDSGVTWSQKGTGLTLSVSVSGDGSRFFYTNGSYVYGFTGAAGVIKQMGPGSSSVPTVESNIDGTKLAILMSSGSPVYRGVAWSTFDGNSFTGGNYLSAGPILTWSSMEMSDNAVVVATATGADGQIAVATRAATTSPWDTSGNGFTRFVGLPDSDMQSVDMSDNGTTVAAGTDEGAFYSVDGGHTWARKTLNTALALSVGVSADGSKLFYSDGSNVYGFTGVDGALITLGIGSAKVPTFAVNGDGTRLAIVSHATSPAFKGVGWSTFDGSSFTAPSANAKAVTPTWSSLSLASDGTLIGTGLGVGGQVFLANRTASGAVYDEIGNGYLRSVGLPVADPNWSDISNDGSTVAIASDNGAFFSKDGGHSWIRKTTQTLALSVAVTADGSRFFYTDGSYMNGFTGLNEPEHQVLLGSSKIPQLTVNSDGTVLAMVSNTGSPSFKGVGWLTFDGTNFSGASAITTAMTLSWSSLSLSDDNTLVGTATGTDGQVFVSKRSTGASAYDAAGNGYIRTAGLPAVSASRVDVSRDGKTVAVASDKGAFFSKDGGYTWTRKTGATLALSVAVSSDGARMFYSDGSYVYGFTGMDGATSQIAGTTPIIDVNSDGTKLLVKSNTGLYTSTFNGTTFTGLAVATGTGARSWQAVSTSDDGLTNIGASTTQTWGQASGGAWAQRTTISGIPAAITLSGDGKVGFSATPNSDIQRSTDYGVTWGATTGSGGKPWTSVSTSLDGSKGVAVASNGDVSTTVDGSNWVTKSVPGAWAGVGIDGTGAHFVAVSATGGVRVFDWN